MKIERLYSGYEELVPLWEASARSSHSFLSEGDILFYKSLLVSELFPAVKLYVIRNKNAQIIAFMGLSDELIEMLFVHPEEQGWGYGRTLIEYAIQKEQITKVDVNEQNESALGFYRRQGFKVIGRDETDSMGKPFPILHLEMNTPRIVYEQRTVERMIRLYCSHKEGNKVLCPACKEILQYAFLRLEHCPFGEKKTACRRCTIHCYKPDMKKRMQEIMRFSGPRMLLYHPMAAIRHLIQR